MKRLIGLAVAVVAVVGTPLAVATIHAQMKSTEELINEAVLPLPMDLRAGATVVTYDRTTGARKVLRQGTNMIECQPKSEDGFTRCYNKVLAPRNDLTAKLRAEGKKPPEIQAAIQDAIKAGTLKPTPFGTMSYRLSDSDKRIKLLWVMSVPGATPETVGVSTKSQRDAALAGHGMPWLMRPGTPGAHIMIPINATPQSNATK